MKVLLLGNPRSHYGTDFLYSGMRRFLGPENVMCFPRKASHYAPVYEAPWNLGIAAQDDPLSSTAPQGISWDLLINLCVTSADPGGIVPAAIASLPPTPLLIVDQEDYWASPQEFYTGQHPVIGDMHREIRLGAATGVTDLLSMSYPLAAGVGNPFSPRPLDLFCVLSDTIPQRGEALRYLQTYPWPSGFTTLFAYGCRPIPQADYFFQMRQAKMAVSDIGGGQDTNRFWEILCNGALLLSRRFPVLPTGFPQPDQEAIYWDDPDALAKIILERRADPEGTLKIAAAGHALGVAEHTDLARARQVLAYARVKLATQEPI